MSGFEGDGYQFANDPKFVFDDKDPRPYAEQWEAWLICRDTLTCDITNYPGSASEQGVEKPSYTVVTKRRRGELL